MSKNLYVGIDLGGTAIKYGLLTASGEVVAKSGRPTPQGRRAILGELVNAVGEMVAEAGRDAQVKAIGIGSPGLVDPERGKVIGRSPNLTGWQGAEIKRTLADKTGLPVAVDNDANAMALAEHRLGAGAGFRSGLYITVGTGIGSGIILDDRLWRGSRYAGAEMGHMTIVKDGNRCPCGKRGCLEVYTNANAIISYYGKPVPPEQGIKYIFDRLDSSGDRAAADAIETAAEYMAAGIGSVLELLDPEIIVLGGGIAQGRAYLPAVRAKLPEYSSSTCLKGLKVKRAKLGNRAGMIGAALLAAAL